MIVERHSGRRTPHTTVRFMFFLGEDWLQHPCGRMLVLVIPTSTTMA